MSAPDERELLPDREIVFTDMLRFPKMLLWSIAAYVGLAMVIFPFVDLKVEFVNVATKVFLPLIGVLIFVFAWAALRIEIRKRRGYSSERFVDVDERSRRETHSESATMGGATPRAAQDDKSESTSTAGTPAENATVAQDSARYESFSSYFNNIREVLERKAAVSDEKASILLDKGVAYSQLGIVVFVASIIGWQILSWRTGFKLQYIYGIVSSSLLFVFIEFLSAWFLKQYRHFVDTSTYLIKVKSIFDRYMLSYHVAMEFESLDSDERANSQMGPLLELMRDDIKWPDDLMIKNADVSFARETLQSVAEIVKATKKSQKK